MQTASSNELQPVRREDMGAKLAELDAKLEEAARRIEEVWERLLDEDEDGEEEE